MSLPLLRRERRKSTSEIPTVKFTDITAAAGIKFVHNNGAYGDKLLPETMGGGVAFFDYDNDGHQDLLFVNSTYWPGHVPPGKPPPTMALYRNDGRGRFTDATAGSGLDVSLYGMGVAVGDYDNDGLSDVFITAVGGNHLFHNEGQGKFREVTPSGRPRGCARRLEHQRGLDRLRQRRQAGSVRLQLRPLVARNRSGRQFRTAHDRPRLRPAAEFSRRLSATLSQ